MMLNSLKIIWRRIVHQKMYSLIKIGGFAVGIAACLLIPFFIVDEHSYNRQFKDGDRILRVLTEKLAGIIRKMHSFRVSTY